MNFSGWKDKDTTDKNRKPSRIGYIAIYLIYTSVVVRTITNQSLHEQFTQYIKFELIYLILFTLIFALPFLPNYLKYLYFIIQGSIVLFILSFDPEFDFVILLFLLLSYQASLFFRNIHRWILVISLIFLSGSALIFYLGILRGLALALTTVAAQVVILAYLTLNEEIETAKAQSQVLLNDLGETHRQLKIYASQIEEMAVIQERNRLAKTLHDTVHQLIFSISLTTRSAELLLEKDPKQVSIELNQLQTLTVEVLSHLRSIIHQLKPEQKS